MKLKTILILGLVVGLVLLVGCETQSSNSPPPSGPTGGGCGVAPNIVEDSNSVNMEELAEKLDSDSL